MTITDPELKRRHSSLLQACRRAGLPVLKRWESLDKLMADVGPCPGSDHVLTRLDFDQGMLPGNVVWLSRRELQQRSSARQHARKRAQRDAERAYRNGDPDPRAPDVVPPGPGWGRVMPR